MDLINEEIGKEGKVEVEISEGKLKLIIGYKGQGGGADVIAFVEGAYFLDKLAAAIPGQIDDAIIGALKAAIASK